MFRAISSKEAREFLLPKHYSGRTPSISFAYGYYYDGKLSAVCTFGKPASNALCEGVCGKEYKSKVYELNRLCRVGYNIGIQLSKFVAWCLRDLKKNDLIIVSYSDTGMYHHGYVYQSTNFIYTGLTKGRTDKYTDGNKHSRHYNNKNIHLRKVRTPKHRYIYFACNKKCKKIYNNNLKYPVIKKYPKGQNGFYKLGDYQKTKVINKNTGEEFYV